MNLKLRSLSRHNFGSTNCHRGGNQNREPRGRVLSDFAAIIQVQLLQQPQQQQQQEEEEGQRTDNMQWKFKGNDLDDAGKQQPDYLAEENGRKRDVDGERLLGELLSPQLRSR